MSNWFKNHQLGRGHKYISSLTLLLFKTRIEWPSVLTATASFPSVFFYLLQYSKLHPSFSAHRAALMTNSAFIYQAFSLRFLDFAVQFSCRRKLLIRREAIRVKFDSGLIFLDQSQFFATHSNQWDCFILYRQQITSNGCFPACSPKWAKAGFQLLMKDFEIENLQLFVSLLFKTNRFQVAVRLFSNRSQRASKSGENISYTLGYRLECHILLIPHFDVILTEKKGP